MHMYTAELMNRGQSRGIVSHTEHAGGDRVLLHSLAVPRGKSTKFYLLWQGPYIVAGKLPDNVFRIQHEIFQEETAGCQSQLH